MIDVGWLGKYVNTEGCPKIRNSDNERRNVEDSPRTPILFVVRDGKEIALDFPRKVGFVR